MADDGRVRLEKPSARRQDAFLAAVRRSRRIHDFVGFSSLDDGGLPRVPAPDSKEGQAGYFLCLRDSGELAGVVNISEIVPEPFLSGYLGYFVFAPHERQGIMSEGLSLVIRDAFGRLGLHRLEANIQPGNEASVRLAVRLGFRREGFSPRYLKIRGRWRDHERWTILADQ